MADIDIERLRKAAILAGPFFGHTDECLYEHMDCAVLALIDHLTKVESERDEAINALVEITQLGGNFGIAWNLANNAVNSILDEDEAHEREDEPCSDLSPKEGTTRNSETPNVSFSIIRISFRLPIRLT